MPEGEISDIPDGTVFDGLESLALEGGVEEFVDTGVNKGGEPEGVSFEGLDRPDWGTSEEKEAWEWLRARGLDRFA